MSNRSPDNKLFTATRNGHEEVLRRYIAAGGDLNILDHDGWTLLMHAAVHDQVRIVRILLEAKADPRIADEFGVTAHSIALKRGFTEISTLLQQAASG